MLRRVIILSVILSLMPVSDLSSQGSIVLRPLGRSISKRLIGPLGKFFRPFRPGPRPPLFPNFPFDELYPYVEDDFGLRGLFDGLPGPPALGGTPTFAEYCDYARLEGEKLLRQADSLPFPDQEIEAVTDLIVGLLKYGQLDGAPIWGLEESEVNLSFLQREDPNRGLLSLSHYHSVKHYRAWVKPMRVERWMAVFEYCRAFLRGLEVRLVYAPQDFYYNPRDVREIPASQLSPTYWTLTFFVAWPGADAAIKGRAFGNTIPHARAIDNLLDRGFNLPRISGTRGIPRVHRALNLPVRHSLRRSLSLAVEMAHIKVGVPESTANRLATETLTGLFPVTAGQWKGVPCELLRNYRQGTESGKYRHSRFQDLALGLLKLHDKLPTGTALSDSLAALVLDAAVLGFQPTPDSIPVGFVVIDPPWYTNAHNPPAETHLLYVYWKPGIEADEIDVERVLNIVYVGTLHMPFEILEHGIESVIKDAIRDFLLSGKKKQ